MGLEQRRIGGRRPAKIVEATGPRWRVLRERMIECAVFYDETGENFD